MKTKVKKALSMLLSLMMVFGLFAAMPLTASADGPPVAVDDFYNAVEGTVTPLGSILANDAAVAGATVGKVVVSGTETDVPTTGLTFTTALSGSVTILPDGTFLYSAPVRNHTDDIPDVDSFRYRVKDAYGVLSDLATVYIDILDTVPVAVDDYYTLSPQEAASYFYANVTDNDVFSADYIKTGPVPIQNIVWQVRPDENMAIVSVPDSHYDPAGPYTILTVNEGKLWINQDGSFRYAAPSGFVGEDSFQYKLNDGDNTPSGWAEVAFNVPAYTFTVAFVDWDGAVLKSEEVIYGSNAAAPADPSRPGWMFTGWDADYSNIVNDLTVTAKYDLIVVKSAVVTSFIKNLQGGNNNNLKFTVLVTMTDGSTYVVNHVESIKGGQKGSKVFDYGGYAVDVVWNDNNMVTKCEIKSNAATTVPTQNSNSSKGNQNQQ